MHLTELNYNCNFLESKVDNTSYPETAQHRHLFSVQARTRMLSLPPHGAAVSGLAGEPFQAGCHMHTFESHCPGLRSLSRTHHGQRTAKELRQQAKSSSQVLAPLQPVKGAPALIPSSCSPGEVRSSHFSVRKTETQRSRVTCLSHPNCRWPGWDLKAKSELLLQPCSAP